MLEDFHDVPLPTCQCGWLGKVVAPLGVGSENLGCRRVVQSFRVPHLGPGCSPGPQSKALVLLHQAGQLSHSRNPIWPPTGNGEVRASSPAGQVLVTEESVLGIRRMLGQ